MPDRERATVIWRWASQISLHRCSPHLVVIAGVASLLLLTLLGQMTAAQSAATPAASLPIRCDVPLQTEIEGTDAATPIGTDIEASPVSSEATPIASESVIDDDLDRLARTLAECLTEGDYETVARLTTPAYRGLLVGTGEDLDAETFVAVAESLTATPLTIRSVSNVETARDERATAEVLSIVARQLVRARWTFELVGPGTSSPRDADGNRESNRRWIVSGTQPMDVDPPADAEEVDVTLVEYAIDLEPATVDSDSVVLNVKNEGENDHEIIVFRLEGDATVDALIYQPGPTLPEGITFAGQVNVEAGGAATMTLVGLETGRYAVVDLSPDTVGVPNLSRGMGAILSVDDTES